MPSDSCTSMITSLSLSLSKRVEFHIHLFPHYSFSIFPSRYLSTRIILLFTSYLIFRFLFRSYFFVFLQNVTLALSSACRNAPRLQITRLFSTCTFLAVSSRTFTFSVSHLFFVFPFDPPTLILHADSSCLVRRRPPILHAPIAMQQRSQSSFRTRSSTPCVLPSSREPLPVSHPLPVFA